MAPNFNFYIYLIVLISITGCKENSLIEINNIGYSSSIDSLKTISNSVQNFKWNSGKAGYNWIEFDVAKHQRINRISFNLESYPTASYKAHVLAKFQGNDYFETIFMRKSKNQPMDTIIYDVDFYLNNVSRFRIEVTNELSWNVISNLKIEGYK